MRKAARQAVPWRAAASGRIGGPEPLG
jgi:hypothetical protein